MLVEKPKKKKESKKSSLNLTTAAVLATVIHAAPLNPIESILKGEGRATKHFQQRAENNHLRRIEEHQLCPGGSDLSFKIKVEIQNMLQKEKQSGSAAFCCSWLNYSDISVFQINWLHPSSSSFWLKTNETLLNVTFP